METKTGMEKPKEEAEKKKPRLWTSVPQQYMNAIQTLVDRGFYFTRGEAVRAALMLLFKQHEIEVMSEWEAF